MNLVPINDKIIVSRVKSADKTKGGIVIPDAAKEKPRRGRVIAVGCGRMLDDGTRVTMSVSEGDEVFFTPYGGSEVTFGDDEFVVLTEAEILAKAV